MKYYTLKIHGYVEFFMLNDKGYHTPEVDKKKPTWAKTIVAQNRIDAMVEIDPDCDIFDHITNAYLVDPKRVAIATYKKSQEQL